MSDEDNPPTCLRCKQLYTVECGYELAKHGRCWACCSDIVEELVMELKDVEDLASLRRNIALHIARAEAHGNRLGRGGIDEESLDEEKRWLALLTRFEANLPKSS